MFKLSRIFKEIDSKTLKKLHEVQVEILDEIDRICRENNIQYFLVGGTLLGAVRHKGFIPWDDDLDIAMVREDYEKFIKVCKKELDSKYYLDCAETNKDFNFSFAKIRKNNTLFEEPSLKHLDIHKGIYVDIFPMDVVGKNFKLCFIKGFFIKNLVETVFYKRKIYDIKKCRHPLFVKVFSVFSCNFIYKLEKFVAKFGNRKKNTHLVSYCGAYSLKKDYFERNVFFLAKLIEFEGKKYPGLNDNDRYLTSLYGNYMELPPKEKRVNHSALDIDFEKGENKVSR